jgi:hypothetical protein
MTRGDQLRKLGRRSTATAPVGGTASLHKLAQWSSASRATLAVEGEVCKRHPLGRVVVPGVARIDLVMPRPYLSPGVKNARGAGASVGS